MSKEKRYLIATADERTWKFDRPVVFLGEWCRRYDRKHVWESMDAVVAEPYGLGLLNKDADFAEARKLEEKLFPLLCRVLNEYHGTAHKERFWKILVGHWFRRYIDVILNRFKTLQQCLSLYDVAAVTAHENGCYSLAPLDSYAAIWAFNDDRWNDALNTFLLNFLRPKDLSIEFIQVDSQLGFNFNALPNRSGSIKKILKSCCYLFGSFAKLFISDKDALIIHSYLPHKEEINLNFSLVQFPQFHSLINFEVRERPDRNLRLILAKKLYRPTEGNVEDVLRMMLFELIPVSYLEGFSNLMEVANSQSWPKTPKFIFTSNSFDTNEVFKIWTANKTEQGFKYIVGQHGNNYGTYRYMYPSIEEETADKFLTWGWMDGLSQHSPAFVFKIANKKSKQYNPQGGLLLIEDMFYHRLDTWDRCAEYSKYSKDQVEFTRRLLASPLSKLTVRLHSSFKYNNPSEEQFWHDVNPEIKIDTDSAILDLISQSRLIVHSYDSTGILETMAKNIPTIAFWFNGFDHLRETAKPSYQLLVDVGIVHLSPESASSKINDIWDDVDAWWFSAEVQNARELFCKRFARVSDSPIADLKKIFQHNL